MMLTPSDWFDIRGRALRGEWWFRVLVLALAMTVASMAGAWLWPAQTFHEIRVRGGVLNVVQAPFLLAQLAVTVRRLHDRNRSGWWLVGLLSLALVSFVALLGPPGVSALASVPFAIAMIWAISELGFWPGSYGSNRYGADPILAIPKLARK